MLSLWSVVLLPLVVAHGFKGIPHDNRKVEKPGLVRYPITVVDGAPTKDRLYRRQNEVDLAPQKSGFFYSIEVELGTPAQPVSVNFDTGSNELWVNPSCTKSADPAFCNRFGRFNGSQTFVDVKRNTTINYGTGFAKLEFGYDYVHVGSAKISQQLFGVATDSEFAVTGILGAGPALDGWKSHYPTVIDNLATQGFTNSRAFSLDIRSFDSNRGSVVFGGLDTRKFSGNLEKLSIVPADKAPDGLTRYWVYLDGVSILQPNGSTVSALDKPKGQIVLVDSGYTVSALPSAIFDKLVAAFPEAKPPTNDSNLYELPCSLADSDGRVDFKFGKTVVNVPFDDFIWHQKSGKCVLGATRDDDFPVLGDTFLRAAYVVYDWDNRNLHIANQDCGSNLVAIGKGPDAVPSVVGECGPEPTDAPDPTPPFFNTTYPKGLGNPTAVIPSGFIPTGIIPTGLVPTGLIPTGLIPTGLIPSSRTSRFRPSGRPAPSPSSPGSSTDSPSPPPFSHDYPERPPLPFLSSPGYPGGSHTPSSSPSPSGYPEGPLSAPSSTPGDSAGSPAPSSPGPDYSSSPYTGSSDVPTYTSIFTSTRTYPASSCLSSDCSAASVVTETITGTTTWCPGGNAAPTPSASELASATTDTMTASDCRSTGCESSSSIPAEAAAPIPSTWSDVTATWTIPRTYTCTQGDNGCSPGQKITSTHTVVVKPMTTGPSPTPVPGCSECRMPPPVTVTATQSPPSGGSYQAPSAFQPVRLQTQSAQPPEQDSNPVPGTASLVARPTTTPMVTADSPAKRVPMMVVLAGILLAIVI